MALQLGDVGAEVESLQTQLVALGFPLATDGFFGPLTDDGVRGFQAVVGLVADGIVGPLTEGALASGAWADVADDLVALPLKRRVTTDTITGVAVATHLEADVAWPTIVLDGDHFDVTSLNAGLDAMAHGWIADLAAVEVPPSPVGPHTIDGELEATLIAPSLIGAAGILSEFVSGSAHPHPLIVTANLDLANETFLEPSELFMPGTGWLAVLRGIVLLTFAPNPGNDAVADNYRHLSLTPEGVRIHLQPEQAGLPLAAGVQTVKAQWAKIEGVIRPSIAARAAGHEAGGPGPHVP